MEVNLTIRKKDYPREIFSLVDGIIIGSLFARSYDLDKEDMKELSSFGKENGLKVYATFDNFVFEDELGALEDYLAYLKGLEVDGIYFHDFAVAKAAEKLEMTDKLIYDGRSVLCNSLDTVFLLNRNYQAVCISSELCIDEISQIVAANRNKVDIRIFGHQLMSYSRRKFLSNYFREIGVEYDHRNKETLSLVEETRKYHLPIIEDEHGTCIYTDYIFSMFEEISDLADDLRCGIIDTIFIDDYALIGSVCKGYRLVDKENCRLINENIKYNFPNSYSSGYLYQRTNIFKDE